MGLTNAFHRAVENKEIRRIRMMMKDSLLVDPTFKDFYEMEKASRDIEGLYDDHDGRELIYDQSLWNDDYMNKLMVQIVNNFSHERIDHLKKVVRYLRPIDNKNNNNAASDNHTSIDSVILNLKNASKEINDVYKQKNAVLKELKDKRNEAKRLSNSSKDYNTETIKSYQSSIAEVKNIVSTGFGYYIKALDKGYKEIIDSVVPNKQKSKEEK